MKYIKYIASCLFLLLVFSFPVYAQKLPVGTKGFEVVARSTFTKEGGYGTHFNRFYKNLTGSLKGKSLTRTELRDITRIYLKSKISIQESYRMALQSKAQNMVAVQLPSDVPFISTENIKSISSMVWKRDNLGTPQELEQLQRTLYSFLSQYPNKHLTLQEFYYVASKYTFEGANSIKNFFKMLPERPLLTHVQISLLNKKPLDVFVYPDQVHQVISMYYDDLPFRIEKGKVIPL